MPTLESHGGPMLLKIVITCIISKGSAGCWGSGFLGSFSSSATKHKQLALSSFVLLSQFVKLRSYLQADKVHVMIFTMCIEILRQKVLYKCKNIIVIQLVMSSAPKQNESGNLYFASNLLNRFPCLCHLNSTSMEQDKIEHLAHSCRPNLFSSCCFLFSYQVLTRMKYMDFSSWLTLCIM